MKKHIRLSAIIMTVFLLLSCGKKDIWNDLEKEGFTLDIIYNVHDGKYDLNVLSKDGFTVLTKYISEISVEAYHVLVKAGADINLKDNNGNYPLLVMLANFDYKNNFGDAKEILLDLITNVKDINVLDSEGRNALAFANVDFFEELIKRGIDTSVVDKVNDTWPVFTKCCTANNTMQFLKLLDNKDFKICTDESWLDDENLNTRTSYTLVKCYLENKANPEKIVQNNEVEELDQEEKQNRLVLPSLLCDWEDPQGYNRKSHYLMTDMVFENGADYHIGDKVTILGYYTDGEGQGEPDVVDGYAALNYEVEIDGFETVLNGRYINMFDSIKDIDGDGKEEMLLSTYAYKWEDFSSYSDTIPFYLFTEPDTRLYSVDVIYIRNGVAQKLEPQNKQSFLCDRLGFAKDMMGACPIIVGQEEVCPLEEYKEFYFICGNKICPITKQLFTYSFDEYDVSDGYNSYNVIKIDYNGHSAYGLQLSFLKHFGEAMEYYSKYYHEFYFILPFVVKEQKPYLDEK